MKLHGLQISVALLVCAASPVFAATETYWAYGVTETSGFTNIMQGGTNLCWAATSSQLWANYFSTAKAKGFEISDSAPTVSPDIWNWYTATFNSSYGQYVKTGLNAYYDKNTALFEETKPSLKNSTAVNTDGGLEQSANFLSALSQGSPVGISFSGKDNPHAVAVWGIEYDTETKLVTKLWLTDSSGNEDGMVCYEQFLYDGKFYIHQVIRNEEEGTTSTGASCRIYNMDWITFADASVTSADGGTLSVPVKDSAIKFSGMEISSAAAGETNGNRLRLNTNPNGTNETFANIDFNRETKISKTDATTTTPEKLTAEFDGATREIYDAKIGANLTLENVSLTAKNSLSADSVSVFLTNAELRGGASGTLTGTFVAGTGTLGNLTISGGNLFAGNSPGLLTLDAATVSGGTLGFYAGSELADAIKNISGRVQITLGENGGMLGDVAVTSGFKITAGTTLSGDITLTLWNVEATETTTGTVSRTFDETVLTGIALTAGSSLQLFSLSDDADANALSGATFALDETWNALLSDGLSWDASKLSETGSLYVIPEPSAFGLLAGFGALALAISRRKRNARKN